MPSPRPFSVAALALYVLFLLSRAAAADARRIGARSRPTNARPSSPNPARRRRCIWGWTVPACRLASPRWTAGAASRPTGWPRPREVKLATVWTAEIRTADGLPERDPGSVSYSAAVESAASRSTDPRPAPFAQRAYREAQRRGFDTAPRRVIIGDGAEWIWNLAAEQFPGAIEIVDLYHAKGHLSDVAKALHGPGTDLAARWGKARRRMSGVSVPGLVLAGGRSSRMGRPKALLPAGAETFVGRIARTPPRRRRRPARGPGARGGPRGADRRRARRSRAPSARRREPRSGPRPALVPRGRPRRWSTSRWSQPAPSARSSSAIAAPAPPSSGRPAGTPPGHGHPVVFGRTLVAALRRADPATGAKPVVRAHDAEAEDVVIDDPGAFTDIDTPDEYRRAFGALPPPLPA